MQRKLVEHELYHPAEDTFFFSKHLIDESGQNALDIGTGSGYLARILSKNFENVVATDINFIALKAQHSKLTNCVCCDAAEPLRVTFDLVICNLPYLPSDEISDFNVDGGREGLEVPLRIIKSAISCMKKNGSFFFLTSSLANHQKLFEETKKLGLDVKIIAREKLFFEELILIKAIKKNNLLL